MWRQNGGCYAVGIKQRTTSKKLSFASRSAGRLTFRQFVYTINPTAQFCSDNAQEFANRGVSNVIHLVMSTTVASRDPSSFGGATERAASSSLHRSAPAAEPTSLTLRKRSFIQ
jgi:hypothetical protein